jgi:hypothetical protein
LFWFWLLLVLVVKKTFWQLPASYQKTKPQNVIFQVYESFLFPFYSKVPVKDIYGFLIFLSLSKHGICKNFTRAKRKKCITFSSN